MELSLTTFIIWSLIAVVVGLLGEVLAHRRGLGGLLVAAVIGWLAIFLVVGVLHFSISGEPVLDGVPIISSILAAVLVVLIWSLFAYRRVAPRYRRYYERRPRRRRWI